MFAPHLPIDTNRETLLLNIWFDIFTDETLADSFIDRIEYTSHRFELNGESLRKKR